MMAVEMLLAVMMLVTWIVVIPLGVVGLRLRRAKYEIRVMSASQSP